MMRPDCSSSPWSLLMAPLSASRDSCQAIIVTLLANVLAHRGADRCCRATGGCGCIPTPHHPPFYPPGEHPGQKSWDSASTNYLHLEHRCLPADCASHAAVVQPQAEPRQWAGHPFAALQRTHKPHSILFCFSTPGPPVSPFSGYAPSRHTQAHPGELAVRLNTAS